MPDQKMRELCVRISTEKDSKKLMELTENLIKLLAEQQETIKSRIKANIGKSPNTAE